MKAKMILMVGAAALVARAGLADESALTAKTNYNNAEMMNPPLARNMMGEHLGRTTKATQVLGASLKNSQGETVGKVKDLAVDVEAGRIVFALVSSGGVIGVGGTVSAVPPGLLHQDYTNETIHLDLTKDQLEAAKLTSDKWSENCDTNTLAAIYSRFGQEPFFLAAGNRPDTNLMTPKQLDLMNDNQPMRRPGNDLGIVERASKVIGMPVSNMQDQKLGRVDDLVLDVPAGRIVAVILRSGGDVGTTGDLSAIPPSAFRYNATTNGLLLDASQELLNRAPHFSSSQWPDLDQTGYTSGIYRAYSIQPYFNTNAMAHDVDNTARNVRDRNSGALTPFDQGNSTADIHTTAEIRQRIVAHKEFSTDAKNVKVITRDGKVTLRGPVNTTTEKAKIGEIADQVAGGDNVDNQLDVKLLSQNN